jgi:DNA-binding transcriptional regulator PaaX
VSRLVVTLHEVVACKRCTFGMLAQSSRIKTLNFKNNMADKLQTFLEDNLSQYVNMFKELGYDDLKQLLKHAAR